MHVYIETLISFNVLWSKSALSSFPFVYHDSIGFAVYGHADLWRTAGGLYYRSLITGFRIHIYTNYLKEIFLLYIQGDCIKLTTLHNELFI